MAAPTVGTAGTAQGGTGASLTTITLPAGIAANNIIVEWAVSCCTLSNGDTPTTAFTWTTGYTEGASVPIKDSSGNTTGRAGWAWKRATGADSGNITISRDGTTGATTSFLGNCVAIAGCRTTGDPFSTKASNNPNYSATVDWPAVTTTGPNDSLLILLLNGDNVNIGTPANYTAVASNATTQGKDSGADVDKRENVAAGTYDPANATMGANDNTGWATFQIAFTDQAGAVTVTPSAGAVTVAGLAPTDKVRPTPGLGAITVAGLAPTMRFRATPGIGAISVAGLQIPTRVYPSAGTVSVAGLAPTAKVRPTPGLGTVSVAGLAPTMLFRATPGLGAISVAGLSPSVGGQLIASPDTGTISVAGLAPTVRLRATPGLGAVALAGLAPGARVVSLPGLGPIAVAGLAPTFTGGSAAATPTRTLMGVGT